MMKAEQEAAEMLCHKWQRNLRLQDWQVYILVKRRADMLEDYKDCYGYCIPNLQSKQAIITIRSEIDHDDDPLPYDAEQVIVHELLHLFTADLSCFESPGSLEYIAMEQMIEILSWAFVKLDRRAA